MGLIRKVASIAMLGGAISHTRREPPTVRPAGRSHYP